MERRSATLRLSEGAVRAARGLARALPGPIRRRLDDRLFFAIFQVTRVTNDGYGWRPARPGAAGEERQGPGQGPP